MLKAVCIMLGVAVNALPADIELAPNGRGTNFATLGGLGSTLGEALQRPSCGYVCKSANEPAGGQCSVIEGALGAAYPTMDYSGPCFLNLFDGLITILGRT